MLRYIKLYKIKRQLKRLYKEQESIESELHFYYIHVNSMKNNDWDNKIKSLSIQLSELNTRIRELEYQQYSLKKD